MSENTNDRRSFPLGLELRTAANKPPTLSGLAVPYNELSEPIGEGGMVFREKFQAGAFAEYLSGAGDVLLDISHDSGTPGSIPLARRQNGSLTLTETSRGLWVSATLPNTIRGLEIAELVRSGLLSGLSITFRALKDVFERTAAGLVRTVQAAQLPALAVVSSPAYPSTNGSLVIRGLRLFTGDDPHASKLAEMDRVVKLAEMDTAIYRR